MYSIYIVVCYDTHISHLQGPHGVPTDLLYSSLIHSRATWRLDRPALSSLSLTNPRLQAHLATLFNKLPRITGRPRHKLFHRSHRFMQSQHAFSRFRIFTYPYGRSFVSAKRNSFSRLTSASFVIGLLLIRQTTSTAYQQHQDARQPRCDRFSS